MYTELDNLTKKEVKNGSTLFAGIDPLTNYVVTIILRNKDVFIEIASSSGFFNFYGRYTNKDFRGLAHLSNMPKEEISSLNAFIPSVRYPDHAALLKVLSRYLPSIYRLLNV